MLIQRRSFLAAAAAVALSVRLARSAPAKRKKIVLRTGWDTVNIGDIGHTPGTLRVLEQHLPDVDVVVWASSINDSIREMVLRRFPKVRIVRGSITSFKAAPAKEIVDEIATSDLVLHNSSMGQSTILMDHCRRKGIPFGYFGQSCFPDFVADPKTVELLNGTNFFYCRDTITLETMKRAGVRPPVLAFNPDGCFGIDVRDDVRADAFLRERGLEDRKFITVMLRTNTQKHPGTDTKLNPANPTPAQQADDERRAEVFRKLITTWVKTTGLKALIAPEVEKEIKHNKRLILDRLPADVAKNVVLRDVFWNADEAASVFARAHTVVCHEPHSCIIALAMGTPILHTYSAFHSPKYRMFADIGLPEWLPSLDELPADEIIGRLMSIHDDYPTALAKVKKSMDFVHAKFAESTKVIRGIIG